MHKTDCVFLIFLCLFFHTYGYSQKLPVYKDSSKTIATRVEDLMSRMTLQKKIQQLQSQLLFLPKYT